MSEKKSEREVVMSYLTNLDKHNFEGAGDYLGSEIKIRGPAGETFRNTKEFLEMLKKQQGNYEIKKVFVDGNDVAVFYDFKTPKVTAFMASWYGIKKNKIVSIQTIFDPRLFE